MAKPLREVIAETTKHHLLENNGFFFCQNLLAVGRLNGTFPELTEDETLNVVELPTSDVSNSGIVTGAALAGRRPIYAIRYQGFLWYNAATLVNYAAKSKEMWNVPCPVFVRMIGMEGNIGPVASHQQHGMIARMPGVKLFAPMTPNEWLYTWNYFQENTDPVFCSEDRRSYNLTDDFPNRYHPRNRITVIAIGGVRISATEYAVKNSEVNLFHLFHLKPLVIDNELQRAVENSQFVFVFDSDYQTCGLAEHVAMQLVNITHNANIYPIGLKDKVAGFAHHQDVVSPSSNEIDYIIRKTINSV